MAYVGNPIDTQNTFQSLVGKRFSGDGSTTAFTLDVAPSSTLDLEVFVGNVRQDPNSAYTLSGTTLTFTGAPPSGTNNIYVVHQAKSVGTIDVPDDIISGKTLVTLDNSNDHVLIEDATDGELKKALIPSASTVADTFTINGSTPTLTIGDAGAEDTKIVFDGNAQDFHIGLDDSADDLVIGLGSSLGTTTHMSFDETGAILKPLQPCFLLHTPDTSQTFATGSGDDITFQTEVFDQNADVSSSIFTAPVTGRYMFCTRIRIESYTNDDPIYVKIITSNRTYYSFMRIGSTTDDNTEFNFGEWVITEMDANDTAKLTAYNSAGNGTVAAYGEAYFSGVLLC